MLDSKQHRTKASWPSDKDVLAVFKVDKTNYWQFMKEDGSLIKSGLNGLFLAGTGVLVLLTKGILFAGPIEYIVAGAATLWGVYVLLTDRTRRNVGLASLAGGGMMMIFIRSIRVSGNLGRDPSGD